MSAAILVPIILFTVLIIATMWLGGVGVDVVAQRRNKAK
jgi:hypothetical protein